MSRTPYLSEPNAREYVFRFNTHCAQCQLLYDHGYVTEDGRFLCAPCNVARLYSILGMLAPATGEALFEGFMQELRKRASATGRTPGDITNSG